jgi:hypothetical protein
LNQRRGGGPDLARRQAERGGTFGIEAHVDLRDDHLRLDGEVDDPRHAGDGSAYRLRLRTELIELRPVHTHHHRRARAREDLLDALAKVGQEIPVKARIAVDDRLDARDGRLVVHRRVEADPQLREVGPDYLVGHLGAADVRTEVLDAGHGHQLAAGTLGDAPHRVERRAGLFDPVHQEVVLAEVRQELFAEKGNRRRCQEQHHRQRAERCPRPLDDGRKHPAIAGLQAGDEPRLAGVEVLRQQQERQSRRHGERHAQRRDDREHIGQRQRPEKGPGQSFEHEHRDEDDHDDQAAVEDRAPHLHRGVEDDADRRPRVVRLPVQAQPPHDVLDVDDGVVHDLAERDHQAREHHGVEGAAAIVKQQPRGEQRQRYRRAADERRAPVGEERQQNDDDKHAADEQRP